MSQSNLRPVQTKEEARERGRNGGIASGEARRAKKNLKETMKALLEMKVVGDKNQENLKKFGISEEDSTYQTAIAVRLLQKGLVEGDTSSIRLIGELTGELSKFGFIDDDPSFISDAFPVINLPDNGRDRRKAFEISPQAGPQTMFMMSPADIVIYGGAAGGGKTYALLLEGLRHKDVRGFGGVIFRKNYKQITTEGGLWDASHKIYDQVADALPKKTPLLHWEFGGKSNISFAHIERDDDLGAWMGSEIAYIGFDELTHFTKHQFFYMLSRNRTTCGVKPYVRASCNPDADSWVAEFISWWIDQDTGYPIPERSGQLRWMIHRNDEVKWFNSKQEASEYALELGDDQETAEIAPKSVTFIASKLEDNRKLMESDPAYRANLLALTNVDMERLLKGNWKIRPAAGSFFKRSQVREMLDKAPDDLIAVCRGWDLAATDTAENDEAAFTAGVLMGTRRDGSFVILDVINQRLKAGDVRRLIEMTAKMDAAKYPFIRQRLPQDPGQAGKEQAQTYISMLSGYDVVVKPESGDKITRAEPMAAQWQHGNFSVVIGEWNDMYLNQLESFPESKFKDMVDAGSSAFNELALGMGFNIDNML